MVRSVMTLMTYVYIWRIFTLQFGGFITSWSITGAFLQIILVQFILFFKSSYCKMASGTRNSINSVPQTAGTTVAFSAFSSVFFLLLWSKPRDRFVWRTTDLEMQIEREKVRTYRTPKIARTHRLILCHGSVINCYFYALSYGMFYF